MATSSLLTKSAKGLDRPTLLKRLGVPAGFPLVGDFPHCTPVNLDTASNLRIDASDVHVLNFGSAAECCSGARLVRFHRKTAAVPCFAEPDGEEGGGAFCKHCLQLWQFADDKGVYRLVKRKMPFALEAYKAGKKQLLHRLPQLKEVEDFYSEEIAEVRKLLDGTEFELSASWPDMQFKDMLQCITVTADVLNKESSGPVRRLLQDQIAIGHYAKEMTGIWLRLRAVFSLTTLKQMTHTLGQRAQTIQQAARRLLHEALPKANLPFGAITAADVMIAGFRSARGKFDELLEFAHRASEEAKHPGTELEWGPSVAGIFSWAKDVKSPQKASKAPQRVKSPAKPKAAANDEASPQATQFFAVAHGRCPGVYMSREEVRAQTGGVDGKMKICASMTAAQAYVRRNFKVLATPASHASRAGKKGGFAGSSSKASAAKSAHAAPWFVAVETARPGIYESQPAAESYNTDGRGQVFGVPTLDDAYAIMGTDAAERYDGFEINSAVADAPCYVVTGGGSPGVYATDYAVFAAQLAAGGTSEDAGSFSVAAQAWQDRHRPQ